MPALPIPQNCAPCFADGSFDFIYVDARHDYRGVAVDIAEWWPKLRPGGIFAGHDYYTQADIERKQKQKQDWTVNFDGMAASTLFLQQQCPQSSLALCHPRAVQCDRPASQPRLLDADWTFRNLVLAIPNPMAWPMAWPIPMHLQARWTHSGGP